MALVALGIGAWLILRPVLVLEVATRPEGRVVWVSPVGPGYRFTLAYRHSIYDVPVEERFEVDARSGLRLREIRAGNEAAVQYYDLPGRIEREGGYFVLGGIDRPVPEIPLLVDSVGRRVMILEGEPRGTSPRGLREIVPLYRLVPDGQALSLRVVRRSAAARQLEEGGRWIVRRGKDG